MPLQYASAATNDDGRISPPLTSATLRDLTGDDALFSLSSPTPPPASFGSPAPHQRLQPPLSEAPRAASQSPNRRAPPMAIDPPPSHAHTLNNAKSTPALAARPVGSVRNMASRFDQAGAANGPPPPQLRVEVGSGRSSRNGARSPTKSPTKRLQKQRPPKPRTLSKSPQKSPSKTSFETSNSSFSSTTTINSRVDSSHKAGNAKNAPYLGARPLFGEIRDGKWNGNFPLGDYGPLPTFAGAPRRGSDGSVALGHGRSASHQEILQPDSANAPYQQTLNHRRSRSAIDAYLAPSLPNLNETHAGYPTPPASASRQGMRKESASRIPVSSRMQSTESPTSSLPQSRSASAMSNPSARNRLTKSPVEASPRRARAGSLENGKPSSIPSRSRYDPPASQHNGQTMNAKIVAPATSNQPPLRSSRPRQPVSMATTSASRARAAERFPNQSPKDGRRPSEQWLGKPYDAQQERSRRRIPELGNVNFEERKARVIRALSQHERQPEGEGAPTQTSRNASRSRASHSSRQSSLTRDPQTTAGAQQQPMPTPPIQDIVPGGWPTPGGARQRGLSVDTTQVPALAQREPEPSTADTARTTETVATEFEVDESPVLGRPQAQEQAQPSAASEPQMLLSSAKYQPPAPRVSLPAFSPVKEAPAEEIQDGGAVGGAKRTQQHSPSVASGSGTEFGNDSFPASPDESPSDIGDRWGLGGGIDRQESIRIMLDEQLHDWNGTQQNRTEPLHARSKQHDQAAFTSTGFAESPTDHEYPTYTDGPGHDTPRKGATRDETLKPSVQTAEANGESDQVQRSRSLTQGLREYMATGRMDDDMADRIRNHLEGHYVDISRASANEGSDGFMIGELLAGLGKGLAPQVQHEEKQDHLQAPQYEIPPVTPDTPPGWREGEGAGEAVIYRNEPEEEVEEEEIDFAEQIRRANETYERAQRGEDPVFAAEEHEETPPPPLPKDAGYVPRSSTENRSSNNLVPDLTKGLRISTSGALDLPEIHSAGERAGASDSNLVSSPSTINAPPQPAHAPPPPPSTSATPNKTSSRMSELPALPSSHSERASSELSPRLRRNVLAQSGSSRPSTDSQRMQAPLPGSTSMSSFADSTRQTSLDTASDGLSKVPKAPSPSPEQKKLTKFWYIIKELLDTEHVYHQDVKIVVDIYKPTASVPDLLSAEDKKILFGNLEDIEKFTLWFYDQLRKAVSPFYTPAKAGRSANKRSSYSTTQSDGTTAASGGPPEGLEAEKANTTIIGQTFMNSLQRMETVYKEYLKNHDAANQRLLTLRSIPNIKAWLDECHASAADITSAWDLNSLLVKPTQRIQKYPLLLRELLDNSPEDHPDRNASLDAMNGVVSVLERINSEKKRADLINDLVNGKRKDSDVKSGLARAFGRRTERIKEKVGVVEEFKDPDFDGLAHKMAGHYIRLQIVMRDFQDNVARTDKWMDLMNSFSSGLDLYTDVHVSSLPELESKWRKYGMAIREITSVIYPGHRAAMQKRVIDPLIECLKLHGRPQAMIAKRKKRIVDYARCQSMEKRGEKPDKKTIEASETYLALNDQLKIELPKLYDLTGQLSRNVLRCFVQIQEQWFDTWQRKMKPILEEPGLAQLIDEIEPAFNADYSIIVAETDKLGICNGSALADVANFLSPTTTFTVDQEPSSAKRPPTVDSSKRAMSAGSDVLPMPGSAAYRRRSSGYNGVEMLPSSNTDARTRSNSSLSNRGVPMQTSSSQMGANRPWSNTPMAAASFANSRPATANPPPNEQYLQYTPRPSTEHAHSPGLSARPESGATYFTAIPDNNNHMNNNHMNTNHRFSGAYRSATPNEPTSQPVHAPPEMKTLFVCASLFEFSIDRTRREAGYPYLTYVQGEVFDVVGQKGELWLAKNQDDDGRTLGWIWEQHFVVLSGD